MEQFKNEIFLTSEENRNIEKIKKDKETVYSREPSEELRREHYREVEEKIDDIVMEYNKGVLTLSHTLDNLADMSSHKVVKPNVQIYAFEQMLKLAGEKSNNEILKNEGVDEIIRNALLSIKYSSNNTQKIYFESILHYFTSISNLQKIEDEIHNHTVEFNDEKIKKYTEIISKLRSSAIRIYNNGEFKCEGWEEEEKLLEKIIKDFSTEGLELGSFESDENETVRMLSVLYGKNPEVLKKSLEIGKEEKRQNEDSSSGSDSSGNPWMVVNLQEGHLPTVKKMEESKEHNLPLGFSLSKEESSNGKEFRYYLDFSLSEQATYLYLNRMRHYKDATPRNYERLTKIYNVLKQRIWKKLTDIDPDAAEEIGNIQNLTIRMQTVKDYPQDSVNVEEILHEEEQEEEMRMAA